MEKIYKGAGRLNTVKQWLKQDTVSTVTGIQSMTISAFIHKHISSHCWQAGGVANTKLYDVIQANSNP